MIKNVACAVAVLLSATHGQSAVAQERPSAKPAKPRGFDQKLLKQFPALVRALTGDVKDCGTSDPCQVNVKVSYISDQGKDYCLAQFPEKIYWKRIHPPGTPRRVEWTLVPDAGVTKTFSFDADLGILPFKNKGQMDQNPNGHGLVSGTSGKSFFYVHSNGVTGIVNPVKYVAIVWLDEPGGTEPKTTCGTVDPIIANDGS